MARVDVGSFGIAGNFATPYYSPTTQSYDLPGLRKYLREQIPQDRWSLTDEQLDKLISGEGLPGPLEMYDLQTGEGGSHGASGSTPLPGAAGKVAVDLPGTGTEEDPIVFPDTTVTAPGDELPEQPVIPIGRAYQGGTILELDQLPFERANEAFSGPVNVNGTFYQLGSDGLLYSGDFPAGVVGYGQESEPIVDLTGGHVTEVPLPPAPPGSTDTGTLGLNLGDTPPLLDTPLPEGGHWSGLSEEVWLGLSDEIRAQIDFVEANESDPERAQLKIEALSHTGRFAWQAPEPSATAGIEAYLYDPSARLPDGGFTPLDWDSVEQRRNPGGLRLPDGRVEGDNMSGQLNLPYDRPSHLGFDFEDPAFNERGERVFGGEGIRLRGTRQFIPGGKTYLPLVWTSGIEGLEHQEAGEELPITFTPEEQDALLGSQGWVLKQQPDSEVYSGELTGIDVSEYTERELLELGHLHSGREWTLYLMTKGGRVMKLPWFDGPPRKSLLSWEQKVFNAVRGNKGGVVDLTPDLVDLEQLRDDVFEFIELLGIGTKESGVELPDSTELNIEGAKYGPGGGRWKDHYEERDGRPGVQPGDFDILEMRDGSYKIEWKSWSLDDTGDDDDQSSRRAKLVSNGFEGAESDDGFFLGKRMAI